MGKVKQARNRSVSDDWRDYSTAVVKLMVCAAVAGVMYAIAKAAQKELDDAEAIEVCEHEPLLSRRFSAESSTSHGSQLGRFEQRQIQQEEEQRAKHNSFSHFFHVTFDCRLIRRTGWSQF